MSKVWVVITGWDYEGYTPPRAVFDTERAAIKYADSIPEPKAYNPDKIHVYSYELNKPQDERLAYQWEAA